MPVALALLGAATLVAAFGPMLFTGRAFGPDWGNHLWLVWQQERAISSGGLPTYFVHGPPMGLFYPHFAFYGGSLYALTAYLATLVGTSAAYVLSWVGVAGMAYAGWVWLARLAGLHDWLAHVPAIVFTVSSFRLTVAYAGGAWGEFVAPSAIPVLAAATITALRSGPSTRTSLALAGASLILTGSHTITLVWGPLYLAAWALILVLVLRPRIDSRRVLALLGPIGLGASLNAWFLAPLAAYRESLRIQDLIGEPDFVEASGPYATIANVFGVWPNDPVPGDLPGLSVQLPTLALAWAVLAVALLALSNRRSARSSRWLPAAALAATVLLGVLLILIWPGGAWTWLPHALHVVQFPHRLHTYTALTAAAIVLLGAAAFRRTDLRRRTRLAGEAVLGAILLLAVAAGAWQAWTTPSGLGRSESLADPQRAPATWYDPGSFRDRSLPIVPPEGPRLSAPPEAGADGRLRYTVGERNIGKPALTDLAAPPRLLRLRGGDIVGRDPDGFLVVVPRSASLVVENASPWPVRLGRAISLTAFGIVIAWAVRWTWRRWRRSSR
jgi:hypothetical protein